MIKKTTTTVQRVANYIDIYLTVVEGNLRKQRIPSLKTVSDDIIITHNSEGLFTCTGYCNPLAKRKQKYELFTFGQLETCSSSSSTLSTLISYELQNMYAMKASERFLLDRLTRTNVIVSTELSDEVTRLFNAKIGGNTTSSSSKNMKNMNTASRDLFERAQATTRAATALDVHLQLQSQREPLEDDNFMTYDATRLAAMHGIRNTVQGDGHIGWSGLDNRNRDDDELDEEQEQYTEERFTSEMEDIKTGTTIIKLKQKLACKVPNWNNRLANINARLNDQSNAAFSQQGTSGVTFLAPQDSFAGATLHAIPATGSKEGKTLGRHNLKVIADDNLKKIIEQLQKEVKLRTEAEYYLKKELRQINSDNSRKIVELQTGKLQRDYMKKQMEKDGQTLKRLRQRVQKLTKSIRSLISRIDSIADAAELNEADRKKVVSAFCNDMVYNHVNNNNHDTNDEALVDM